MGILEYTPNLEYPISPPGYIPLNIHTLLGKTISMAQGGVKVWMSRGRAIDSPSRSVTTISSYLGCVSSKL